MWTKYLYEQNFKLIKNIIFDLIIKERFKLNKQIRYEWIWMEETN